jgi:hypothetical protein
VRPQEGLEGEVRGLRILPGALLAKGDVGREDRPLRGEVPGKKDAEGGLQDLRGRRAAGDGPMGPDYAVAESLARSRDSTLIRRA